LTVSSETISNTNKLLKQLSFIIIRLKPQNYQKHKKVRYQPDIDNLTVKLNQNENVIFNFIFILIMKLIWN